MGGVHPHAELAHDDAVHFNPAGLDQFFAHTARGDAGPGEDLLQAHALGIVQVGDRSGARAGARTTIGPADRAQILAKALPAEGLGPGGALRLGTAGLAGPGLAGGLAAVRLAGARLTRARARRLAAPLLGRPWFGRSPAGTMLAGALSELGAALVPSGTGAGAGAAAGRLAGTGPARTAPTCAAGTAPLRGPAASLGRAAFRSALGVVRTAGVAGTLSAAGIIPSGTGTRRLCHGGSLPVGTTSMVWRCRLPAA